MGKYRRYSRSYREEQEEQRQALLIGAGAVGGILLLILIGYYLLLSGIGAGLSPTLLPLGIVLLVCGALYGIYQIAYRRIRQDLKRSLTTEEIATLAARRRAVDLNRYYPIPEIGVKGLDSQISRMPLEKFLSSAGYTAVQNPEGMIIGLEHEHIVHTILTSFSPLSIPVHQIIEAASAVETQSVISIQKGQYFTYADNQALRALNLSLIDLYLDKSHLRMGGVWYSPELLPLQNYIAQITERNNRSVKGNMRLQIEYRDMQGIKADIIRWIFSL